MKKDRSEYMRGYQLRWVKNRRSAWLTQNGPCRDCGSDQNLELDHIDPSQRVSHRVWSWSEERRLAELSKCQVLCRVCHLVKTKFELCHRMKGNRNSPTKLTPQQATEIYQRAWNGEGLRRIARDFGLNHSTVSGIKYGRLWAAVTGEGRSPTQLTLFSGAA